MGGQIIQGIALHYRSRCRDRNAQMDITAREDFFGDSMTPAEGLYAKLFNGIGL